jgi:uncharacterized protein (UPF0248 family)
MRTARDAINRIIHDEEFDASKYVIGYLDRFEGILEKPLLEFDWSTKFADADPEDVTIPQHRIRYIATRDAIAWDRDNKIDLIFGSSGIRRSPLRKR